MRTYHSKRRRTASIRITLAYHTLTAAAAAAAAAAARRRRQGRLSERAALPTDLVVRLAQRLPLQHEDSRGKCVREPRLAHAPIPAAAAAAAGGGERQQRMQGGGPDAVRGTLVAKLRQSEHC